MVKIETPILVKYEAGHVHWCPGCKHEHPLPDRWTFDGNDGSPSFSPSFLHSKSALHGRCHYFIRAGLIEYCGDCDHDLAGKVVPMPPLPADVFEFWAGLSVDRVGGEIETGDTP